MLTISQKKINTCLVLCDKSKKGTLRQCEAIAKLLRDHYSLSYLTIEFQNPFFFKILNSQLTQFIPLRFFNLFSSCKKILNFLNENTIIIAGGRRSLMFASALAKQYPTIALLNPRCTLKNFKAVILPEHDNSKLEKNVITFKGALVDLNIRKIDKVSIDKNVFHVITILLGGDSKYYKYTSKDMDNLTHFIEQKSKLYESTVFKICASRRTNPKLAHHLFNNLNSLRDKICFEFWPHFSTNNPSQFSCDNNPYIHYLEEADEVIVTSDSISMLAEACCIGVPVTLWRLPIIPKKFRRFFDDMVQNKYCTYEDIIMPQACKKFNELEVIKPQLFAILNEISSNA